MRLLHCLFALLPLVAAPLARADLIDDVWERGSLRIALVDDAPPYSFRQDDKLTGYEVDLGHALADELNVKADFIPVPRDKLLDGLRSGSVDIVLGRDAQAARDDQQLEFSEPYGAGGGQQIAGGTDSGGLTQSLAPGQAQGKGTEAGEPAKQEQSIPFLKENPAFRSALNNALNKLKSSGRLDELSRKWLEGQAPNQAASEGEGEAPQQAPQPASEPEADPEQP